MPPILCVQRRNGLPDGRTVSTGVTEYTGKRRILLGAREAIRVNGDSTSTPTRRRYVRRDQHGTLRCGWHVRSREESRFLLSCSFLRQLPSPPANTVRPVMPHTTMEYGLNQRTGWIGRSMIPGKERRTPVYTRTSSLPHNRPTTMIAVFMGRQSELLFYERVIWGRE